MRWATSVARVLQVFYLHCRRLSKNNGGWGAGSTSPSGSVGLLSCTCPKGTQLTQSKQCAPCPRNFYSSNAGVACTKCPSHMVTQQEGSTSPTDCQCPAGYFQHAGLCRLTRSGP